MSFGNKLKNGLNSATRVGSDELDDRRRNEQIYELKRRIDDIKTNIGDAIFISYIRKENMDPRFISDCEKISSLIAEMNALESRRNSE